MSSSSVFGLCLSLLIGSYCYFICLRILSNSHFSDETLWVWDQVKVPGLPELISLSILFPSDKYSLCFPLQLNYVFLWLFYWLELVKVIYFKSMIVAFFSIFFPENIYSIISVTLSESPFIILFSNSYFSLVFFPGTEAHPEEPLLSLFLIQK